MSPNSVQKRKMLLLYYSKLIRYWPAFQGLMHPRSTYGMRCEGILVILGYHIFSLPSTPVLPIVPYSRLCMGTTLLICPSIFRSLSVDAKKLFTWPMTQSLQLIFLNSCGVHVSSIFLDGTLAWHAPLKRWYFWMHAGILWIVRVHRARCAPWSLSHLVGWRMQSIRYPS
jgi:hypothetical protein